MQLTVKWIFQKKICGEFTPEQGNRNLADSSGVHGDREGGKIPPTGTENVKRH